MKASELALIRAQLEVLRDNVGLPKRASTAEVLAKATALLMMYANGERMRQREIVGFSPGPPAEGRDEEEDEDDDE